MDDDELTPEDHGDMVLALMELDDELTDWEVSFVESLKKRLEAAVPLTDRQEEVLIKIWNEKIGDEDD